MHRLSAASALVLSLVALAGCAATAPPSGDAAPASATSVGGDRLLERIERVERGLATVQIIAGRPGLLLADRMAHYNVPGVSIAVVDGGAIAWARGYGVRAAGAASPVDTATLFQAASISKPVAALGALRLVQEGRLSLDDDVNGALRSWRVPPADHTAREKVTLRRLLSHTAGTTVHGFPGYAAGVAVPALTQVLDGAPPANTGAVGVDVEPGSIWRYSGGGTSIVQQLMMDVTGEPFAEHMRRRVLEPLGMLRSTYEQPLPPHAAQHAATAHRSDGSPLPGGWHTYPEQAAAGLWTTPSDLARVVVAVQRWLAGTNDGLLTPAYTAEMLTRQKFHFGLGFELAGEGDAARFSHGGANAGFRAFLVGFNATGQGAVVMTNGDGGGALAREIIHSIAREYGWPAYQPTVHTLATVEPAALAQLAGTYVAESSGTPIRIVVTVDGSSLRLHADRAPAPLTLYPSSATSWFDLDSEQQFTFARASSGAVTHLEISRPNATTLRATRLPDP